MRRGLTPTAVWCRPCSELCPGFAVGRSSWGQLLGKEGHGESWRAQGGRGVSCQGSLCSGRLFSGVNALTETSSHMQLSTDVGYGHPWLWRAKALLRDLSLGCVNRQGERWLPLPWWPQSQLLFGKHSSLSPLSCGLSTGLAIRLSQSFRAALPPDSPRGWIT